MIYAFTPNPALDLDGSVHELVPNEKNYVFDDLRCPGGNAINAARIVHRLGARVIASGFLGGGTGREIASLIQAEGLRRDFIAIKNHTRINVTVSNVKTHQQTRLSFPGPRVSGPERSQFFKWTGKLKPPGLLLIGGSLPPGISGRDIARAVKLARGRGCDSFVDLPGRYLKDALQGKPLLIKPNLSELEELAGKRLKTTVQVIREAQKLLKTCALVCVSSVEGGALLATRGGLWFGETPKLHVRGSLGAGDSMLGAMAAHLWATRIKSGKSWSPADPELAPALLRWGLAAACATVTAPRMRLGSASEIRAFLPKIRIEHLSSPG